MLVNWCRQTLLIYNKQLLISNVDLLVVKNGSKLKRVRQAFAANSAYSVVHKRCLQTSSLMAQERLFSDKHEWISMAPDGSNGTVGISSHAQEALGDIVFVQAPEVGREVKQNEECGALESVKAASEIYSPISGMVIEVNTALDTDPGLINKSCYDKGWIYKMTVKDKNELNLLMSEAKYIEYLKTIDEKQSE